MPKLKVAVISPDLERIIKSSQELTPILESLGDCEHLTIPDLVVAFGFFEGRRSEGDWMPEGIKIIALLRDYSTSGKSWGIDFDPRGTGWTPDGQDRYRGEGGLEGVKSGLLSGAPYKGYILLGEVVKRSAYFGEVFDKASVEIGKPNETPNFFEFHGCCPISDGLYFHWVHGNFAGANDQSEVVNMGLLELALLGSEVEIVFFEKSKNFVDDLLMFLESSAPNEDVIQIDCDFTLGNQICEDGIHQCLKRGRRVGEPEEHDARFEKALVRNEGCLPFIAFFDLDVVVTLTNIKLGEDPCIP
jgi:hypothetical protein